MSNLFIISLILSTFFFLSSLAAPFAALGFVSYHGMPAEKFLWVWFRSEVLEPKIILFKPSNLYYELMKDTIAKHEKEARKQHESN